MIKCVLRRKLGEMIIEEMKGSYEKQAIDIKMMLRKKIVRDD